MADCQGCVDLREYLEVRFQQHDEKHELEQKALEIAKDEINRRLEQMDEFRNENRTFASTYLPRDVYDREQAALRLLTERDRDGLNATTTRLTDRVSVLERALANAQGRTTALAALAVVGGGGFGALIAYLLRG